MVLTSKNSKEREDLRFFLDNQSPARRIPVLIRMVNNIMESGQNRMLGEINLTVSQMQFMAYLFFHKEEEITAINLEKQFRLKNSTVTGIIQRLEEKKFIYRVPSEKDGRNKLIYITEQGMQLQQSLMKRIDEATKEVFCSFSEEEKKNLQDMLERLLDIIS